MEDFEAIQDLENLAKYIREDAPKVVGTLAVAHFKEAFNKGGLGNKKWAARKTKRAGSTNSQLPLNQSGDLKDSIDYKLSGTNVIVYSDSEYAKIHNEGGTISVTPNMKSFFWAMYYEAKEAGMADIALGWKYCALAKTITIEQREFMGDDPELDRKIDDKLTRDMNRITNQ